MYKTLIGMLAGALLTLAGTHLFRADEPASQNKLPQAQAPVTTASLDQRLVQIASELALLQASVDRLNAGISHSPAVAPPENVAQSGPLASPMNATVPKGDNRMDAKELALQKQNALNQSSSAGMTLPDFMASKQFTGLPPEAQDEVMQELVRRFNNGEIDRKQFIPGYKY